MRRGTIWLLVAVAVAVLFPHGAVAGSNCATVKGTSHGTTSTGDFPFTPFAGNADLRTSAGDLTAQVSTFLTGLPVEHGNALLATTSHCLVVEDGSTVVGEFCTADRAVLSETGKPGLLRLNSRLRIASGDWMGSPASGKLVVNGSMQLIPTGPGPFDPVSAVTSWKVKGRICSNGS